MASTSTTINVAATRPVNPPGATPVLTLEHIWPLLQRKIRRAEDFVPMAIKSTDIISTSTNASGKPVTVRDAHFVSGPIVRETVTEYEPIRAEFAQTNGVVIQNIVSEGPDGELNMTYVFEWRHPELEGDVEGLKEKRKVIMGNAHMAVESTLVEMRKMVLDGRWKETDY